MVYTEIDAIVHIESGGSSLRADGLAHDDPLKMPKVEEIHDSYLLIRHDDPSGSLQTHYVVESRASPSCKRGASNKSQRLQTPSQVASERQVGGLDRKGVEHLVSWAKMLRLQSFFCCKMT